MNVLEELSKSANANSTKSIVEEKVEDLSNNNPTETGENTSSVEVSEEPQTQEVANSGGGENPRVFASEEVAEFNAFKERFPDKTIDDYKQLKTPVSEISDEELLRKYYSEKEGMGEKEIAYALKQIEVDGEGEDDDFDDFSIDEDERLKREAKRERDLRLAREWREQYVKEQLSPNANDNVPMTIEAYQERVANAQKQSRDNYLNSIYSALNSIETIELGMGDEKISFVPDEAFRKEMKSTSENIEAVYEKFTDSDGKLKDAKGFITEVALWANPTTREKMIAYRIEQAVLRDRATRDKARRNVGFDAMAGVSDNSDSGGAEAFDRLFQRERKRSF